MDSDQIDYTVINIGNALLIVKDIATNEPLARFDTINHCSIWIILKFFEWLLI